MSVASALLQRALLTSGASASSTAAMARAFAVPAWAGFGTSPVIRHSTTASAPGTSSAPSSAPKDQKIVMPPVGKPSGINQTFASGAIAPHPGMAPAVVAADGADVPEAGMSHPHYDWKYLESIHPVHVPPKDAADRVGMLAVRVLRGGFDWITNYGPTTMTETKWLTRIIFLETVAGVPGMVAGMLRHLHSLRLMRRDKGWISQLLEEAENERMHLLTALELRKPGALTRLLVLATQGLFFNAYFIAYLIWPRACHSFVGYLEEEAVRTYTHALEEIDQGRSLARWKTTKAPTIAQTYWGLPNDATLRDLVLVIRADEACHSHVNHTLKTLKATDPNPFALGKSQLP